MSVLRSIHTLLGGSYLANDYNPTFDKKESGIGYYTYHNDKLNYYELHDSLVGRHYQPKPGGDGIPPAPNQELQDPLMPNRYSLDIEIDGHHTPRAEKKYVPPLVVAVHTSQTVNGLADIDHGVRGNQVICCIPVRNGDQRIKGVIQFRASPRGNANPAEGIAPERLALAEYWIQEMAPLLGPKKFTEHVGGKSNGNGPAIDGVKVMRGLRDRWQEGIQKWSMETYHHTQRVTELAQMLTDGINEAQTGPMSAITIRPGDRQLFKLASELHDVGKLYTPRAILESGVPVPGARYELSKAESAIMERHAQDVYDVLDIPGVPIIAKVRDIAASHHLHANGKGGYPPMVLKEINERGGVPFEAKILAVADIFEAMTADREYREGIGLPLSTTLNIMNGMAKRGAIDAQVFRFAVESGVFDRYAKSKEHISHYDVELLEKVGYSEKDMKRAMEVKVALCHELWPEEGEKRMADLEKYLKMGDKKLLEMLSENDRKPPGEQDKALIKRDQVDHISHAKRELNEEINASVTARRHVDHNIEYIDSVYTDRLLGLTRADMEAVTRQKQDIAERVAPLDDREIVVRMLENLVKSDLMKARGLKLGVTTGDMIHGQGGLGNRLQSVLTEIEDEKIAKVKADILSGIPSAPLSDSENFTLFTPRRIATGAATEMQSARG